jgi:hypothetical protein
MEALIAVDGSKLYARMGYPSLFRYATESLGLSESVAYSAISVARKASVIPELREAVNSHGLGLSKARKVLSVLNPRAPTAERSEWVQMAVTLPASRLERLVAAENPKEAVAERVVYKSAKRIELTVGIWEDAILEIRQAQNLVSNSRGRAATIEDALVEAVRFYLERKDPERRARRVIAKKRGGKATSESSTEAAAKTATEADARPACASVSVSAKNGGSLPGETECSESPARRIPVPPALLLRVRFRDRNQCQARMPDGKRCGSRRWLEVHHRRPVSQGGTNAYENLITLCRSHHQAHHQAHHRSSPPDPGARISTPSRSADSVQ